MIPDQSHVEGSPPGRWRWLLLTLPIAPLALFCYAAFEWLFFATKPSVVSVLPFPEQLTVLVTAPLPVVPAVLLLQLAASLASLPAYPRFRAVALIPAAAILTALVLILTDNFLYVFFGISTGTATTLTRLAYGGVLLTAFFLSHRKLLRVVVRNAARHPQSTTLLLWVMGAPLLLLSAVMLLSAADEPAPSAGLPLLASKKPNILLLSIDGIDATRLSAYGHRSSTTPFLESLREQTLFCENAFTNANQTYSAITAMLTGKIPFHSRVIVPPAILRGDASFQHLPAIFRKAGYRSVQLAMRHFADADDANLQAGFDAANYRWENRISTAFAESVYDSARPFRLMAIDRIETRFAQIFGTRPVTSGFEHVTGTAEDPFWGDERRLRSLTAFIDEGGEPWLAHVHLLDTHPGDHEDADPLDVKHSERTLRDADARVRQIFEMLAKRRQLEHTVVVITSDHASDWSALRRIPLMIRFPGGMHARLESKNAQLVDIAPTLLEYVGARPPAWMDGVSLLSPEASADRNIFAVASVVLPNHEEPLTLRLPGPPNYGALSVSLVAGSSWYTLDLQSGDVEGGRIAGHTRPTPPLAPADAEKLLRNMAKKYGFRAAI